MRYVDPITGTEKEMGPRSLSIGGEAHEREIADILRHKTARIHVYAGGGVFVSYRYRGTRGVWVDTDLVPAILYHYVGCSRFVVDADTVDYVAYRPA